MDDNSKLFAQVRVLFPDLPSLSESLVDFAKASFYAGCNYERAYLNGNEHEWKLPRALQDAVERVKEST